MPLRLKLIANPISGGDARPRIDLAMTLLTELGAEVELFLTSARGDARRVAGEAKAQGFDRVVAAGGDGTLNEVVSGVFWDPLPVAFLPFGTVNVFALETGIPFDLNGACRLAVTGAVQPISLGQIDDELFLLMASAGWDAEAVARVRPGVKRVFGRLAYAVSALETFLLHPANKLTLKLPDGTTRSGYGVVVSNCRYYGGRYVVTPQASLLSDTLAIALLRKPGRLAMFGFATRLLLGRSQPDTVVEFLNLSHVDISGDGIAIQVDGDASGRLPVRIRSLPEAISMVLPEAFKGGRYV
jgi:YegS/Rv2252/BmrU family lipid kinase